MPIQDHLVKEVLSVINMPAGSWDVLALPTNDGLSHLMHAMWGRAAGEDRMALGSELNGAEFLGKLYGYIYWQLGLLCCGTAGTLHQLPHPCANTHAAGS
jgi:hypothetical protein